MEEVDVRTVLARLLKKWPIFLLSLALTFGISFLYLKSTEEKYRVQSSIQLKDESLSEEQTAQQNFTTGIRVVGADAELEDELGILSSYSTIRQAVQKQNNFTSLYRYNNNLGKTGRYFAREIYQEDLLIELDLAANQVIEAPIYLSFLDENTFSVNLEIPKATLYNHKNHTPLGIVQIGAFEGKGTVGKPFRSPFANFTLKLKPGFIVRKKDDYYFKAHTLRALTESYQARLVFAPLSAKSNITSVTLQGSSPEKEIAFLNTLASVYIENDQQKKNQLGQKTIRFIDRQLTSVSDTLQKVESSLEKFRKSTNLVDVNVTSEALAAQLSEAEGRQTELRTQNDAYQSIREYIARNEQGTDLLAPSTAGLDDPSLNNLLTKLADLSGQKSTVEYSSSGNNNPVLNQLNKEIKATKRALSENIRNLIQQSNSALAQNRRRIAELSQSVGRLPKDERSLNNIERKFDLNDNLYNYLLTKRAETAISIASSVPDKNIIDPARQIGGGPVSPNRMFTFLLALLAGLVLPAGLIFAREYFKDVIDSEKQLASLTPLTVVESIAYLKPRKGWTPGEYVLTDGFRFLRHQFDFLSRSKQIKVIGVTSATSGEGKTFCALNLATSFAKSGKKTLLIDFDFYRPALAALLQVKDAPGLRDYASNGHGGVAPITQASRVKNLFLVSAGGKAEATADGLEMLEEAKLESFFKGCRDEFDFILLDTPPLGITPDYLTISKYVDYTLLVVRNGMTEKAHLNRLNKIFEQNAIKGGIIYNGVESTNQYGSYLKKIAAN
ncbi:MAG: AAA family ATPase [Ferruginibacter sp.]|nr:AAA family ATPase [Cytophagales bacterium]